MSGRPSHKKPSHPPEPGIQPWEKLGDELHADCRVFTVQRRSCRHPQRAQTRDFFVIDSADWVNVIALTNDRKIVLIHQFRFGINGFSLEIPGGLVDAGEDPVQAALRELREETGFVAAKAQLIGQVRPNPAILNNTCSFVLAEGAALTESTAWDHDEEIEVVLADVETTLSWARAGKIDHALVLNALFFFEPVWQRLKNGPGSASENA